MLFFIIHRGFPRRCSCRCTYSCTYSCTCTCRFRYVQLYVQLQVQLRIYKMGRDLLPPLKGGFLFAMYRGQGTEVFENYRLPMLEHLSFSIVSLGAQAQARWRRPVGPRPPLPLHQPHSPLSTVPPATLSHPPPPVPTEADGYWRYDPTEA